jgi:hypothetical protein
MLGIDEYQRAISTTPTPVKSFDKKVFTPE